LLNKSVRLFCALGKCDLVRCVKNTSHFLFEQHLMRMVLSEVCIIAFAPRLAKLPRGRKDEHQSDGEHRVSNLLILTLSFAAVAAATKQSQPKGSLNLCRLERKRRGFCSITCFILDSEV
jgi:hypothetical protein